MPSFRRRIRRPRCALAGVRVGLLDAGGPGEFAGYVDTHLDWVPAFRLATAGAAAEAPFHRWAVGLLDDAVTEVRSRLALDPVSPATARTMVDRVPDVAAPE